MIIAAIQIAPRWRRLRVSGSASGQTFHMVREANLRLRLLIAGLSQPITCQTRGPCPAKTGQGCYARAGAVAKRKHTDSQSDLLFSPAPDTVRTLEIHCVLRRRGDTQTIDVEKCGLCGGPVQEGQFQGCDA